MAYRRRRTQRKKKHVFSERAKKAIERIAQGPVETKHFDASDSIVNYLNVAGYVTGSTAVVRYPIFAGIPRLKNTATKTEQSFIGNKIMTRGLRWEFHGWPFNATATPDIQYRFTVYSENNYYSGITGPGPTDIIFDQAFSNLPTWSRWNTQTTKIHFRRTFKLGNSSIGQGSVNKKFWVPLRRTLTSEEEESLLANSFFGQSKGMNYYWVLEVYAPNVGTGLNTLVNGVITSSTYFKDA